MDLPTHFAFGLAIGFVFFGHQPELALLVALGALLPDLDREYWFIPPKKYADEQRHRALLHNVVVIALAYAVSPFLSLGVFLHVLQDSFTTVKDRGVEWFYPFTRLAKRGEYDSNGVPQAPDPKEHVYFYQEDPPGMVKFADPDLREAAGRPVPWRRVYGFALNSHLLDRGFLYGSIAAFLVWLFVPAPEFSFPNLSTMLQTSPSIYVIWLAGLFAVGVLFFSGEIDRSDKPRATLGKLKPIKKPIFFTGLVLLGFWVFLYEGPIGANMASAVSNPFQIVAMILLIALIAYLLIRMQTKGGKQNATI